jgi:osmoprotectant transport system ATP-binding protein
LDTSVNVGITLDEVTKRFPGGGGRGSRQETVAVDSLSMQVPAGQLVAFVGPSGCGKTTTLKMINRLIEPSSGRILLGEDDVTRVNPVALRRRIGYVIQNVGLFPHQTVEDNVATVPRLLGWDKKRYQARATELLELVGLDPATFAKRYPAQLSGGQRQRVGVARALGADPPVLLMDEPFSAIDPIARGRLQDEFLRVQREVRKTIVFVTHDLDEAVRLADRIALFRQGGILEQYGTPAELLGSPATDFVRDFVGGQRGLRRLSVTPIDQAHLDPPGLDKDGPEVRAGGTLQDAMAALLTDDTGRVRVVDDSGRTVGTLTVEGVHAALRRSVHDSERSTTPKSTTPVGD